MTLAGPHDHAIPIAESRLTQSVLERKHALPFISQGDFDHVNVHINGVHFVALLDTGSRANIIHKEVWEQIRGIQGSLPDLEDPQGVYLRGVTGHKAAPLGATWVNVCIGDFNKTISVLVVESIFTPVILNNQFIHEHLDTVRLPGSDVFRYKIRHTGYILEPTTPQYIFSPEVALLAQNAIIPPEQKVRVLITVRKEFPTGEKLTLVGFKTQPETIKLYATPFLYDKQKTVQVYIKNVSHEAITVYRGRPLGRIVPAPDQDLTEHLVTSQADELSVEWDMDAHGVRYTRVDCNMTFIPDVPGLTPPAACVTTGSHDNDRDSTAQLHHAARAQLAAHQVTMATGVHAPQVRHTVATQTTTP